MARQTRIGGWFRLRGSEGVSGGALSRCCAVELWLSRRRQALPSLGDCRVGLLLGLYVSSLDIDKAVMRGAGMT